MSRYPINSPPKNNLAFSSSKSVMDSAPTAWAANDGAEEWQLRHDDDGFTYKILKRQRLSDPVAADSQPPSTDTKTESKHWRRRKRDTLLKLKARYQNEIDRWELLSNTLRAMQDRTNQRIEAQKREQELDPVTASFPESTSLAVKETEDPSGSLIDKLLGQVEAQEAIIHDISNLCDVAEAMCNAQQEQVVESFVNLPVWSSPRVLMASLCDE